MRQPREPYLGLKNQPPGYSFATDRYDQCQIIYVTGGSLAVQSGRGPASGDAPAALLAPGTVLLLPRESRFRLSSEGGYDGVFWLDRAGTGLELDTGGNPWWRPADQALGEIAVMMVREMTAPQTDGVLAAMGRLFVELAMRQMGGTADGSSTQRPAQDAVFRTTRVKQVIDAHLYANRTLHDLLSSLDRSYRQLARDFVSVTGESPKSYQIRRRCEEAQRLLASTSLPITDIAMELGYPSSQHFASQFRRQVGLSPREARGWHAGGVG